MLREKNFILNLGWGFFIDGRNLFLALEGDNSEKFWQDYHRPVN